MLLREIAVQSIPGSDAGEKPEFAARDHPDPGILADVDRAEACEVSVGREEAQREACEGAGGCAAGAAVLAPLPEAFAAPLAQQT